MESRSARGLGLLAALLISAGLACTPAAEDEAPTADATSPALESEDEEVFYALGTQVAGLVRAFDLTEEELPSVQRGFVDQTLGRDLAVDPKKHLENIEALLAARQSAAAAQERSLSEAWVEEQAKAENAKRYDEGYVITTFGEGQGEPLEGVDMVRVRWKGTLRNGRVIGSSAGLGEHDTSAIQLTNSVPCWTLAVQKMRLYGKYKLACPPDLVHGDAGLRPLIPGGAAVEYEIEVRKVERLEDMLKPTPGIDAGTGGTP